MLGGSDLHSPPPQSGAKVHRFQSTQDIAARHAAATLTVAASAATSGAVAASQYDHTWGEVSPVLPAAGGPACPAVEDDSNGTCRPCLLSPRASS